VGGFAEQVKYQWGVFDGVVVTADFGHVAVAVARNKQISNPRPCPAAAAAVVQGALIVNDDSFLWAFCSRFGNI
jgi:hypothetical protein